MSKWDISLLLCILIILHFFIWLRPGLILGGGEAGLMFYQPDTVKVVNQYAWANKALGNPTGIVATAFPTMWIISIFSKLAIPSELIQAFFFFIINLVGAIGMYLLVKSEIPNSKRAPFIAALFYVFNITAMTIIWNRFQYTFMVFYGGIPMALLLFSVALKRRSILYSILTGLMLLAMGFAFASLPLIELAILVFGLYTLYFVLISKQKLAALKNALIIGTTIAAVTVSTNAWWIVQFYEVMKNSVYITSVAYTPAGNLSTFLILSESLGNLSYVFRMMHKDFFWNMKEVWSNAYVNPIFVILTFLIPILAFVPLLKKDKPNSIKFFTVYSLLVLYLMKGAHAPFGFVFTFLFNQFRFLEAFRNPFEKFSLLLPLGYAPLIGYSLDRFLERIKNERNRRVVFVSSLVVICGIIVFPMWNRWVFTSNMRPSNNKEVGTYVQVPPEYKDVNNFLNTDTSLFRSILIPYQGEGIQHNWKYGYSGVELSLEMFDKPMLSLSTGVQFLPQIADPLQESLINEPSHFKKLMQLTNSKYVVTRNDLTRESHKYTVEELESKLTESNSFEKVGQFGKLTIHKLQDEQFRPKVYAATDIITINSTEQNVVELLPYTDYEINSVLLSRDAVPKSMSTNVVKGSIYTANEKTSDERITEAVTSYIPVSKPEVDPENALVELPFVNILPDDPRYPIVGIKEALERRGKKGTDEDFVHMRQTGKRLVELQMLIDKNAEEEIIRTTARTYYEELRKIKYEYMYGFLGVRMELARHGIVLENIQKLHKDSQKYPELTKSLSYINSIFTNGIPTSDNNNIRFPKRDYNIEVPQTKEYLFLIKEFTEKNASPSGTTNVVINDARQDLPTNTELRMQFTQGTNNIKFPIDDQQAINQKGLHKRIVLIKEKNSQFVPSKIPELQTEQLNPAEYEVKVSSAENPFILVFAESYHPLWIAEINGKIVPSTDHFLANSYANGWYIDEKGSYDIKLRFKPQQTMDMYGQLSKWTVGLLGIAIVVLFVISTRKKAGEGKRNVL